MNWKPGRPQKDKYADGPRMVAEAGCGFTLEAFEYCSSKRGTCPSGEFTYVIKKRGVVRAAGPHNGRNRRGYLASLSEAQRAAEARVLRDPKLRRSCKR